MRNNPSKLNLECFESMLAKFKKIQFDLSDSYQDNNTIKKQILSTYQEIKDYSFIL
jgi:hypothetical protein